MKKTSYAAKTRLLKRAVGILLLALLCAALAACGTHLPNPGKDSATDTGKDTTEDPINMENQFVIFADGEYKCNFVVPKQTEAGFADLRNELMRTMKGKFGVAPTFRTEGAADQQAEFELLLGNTNREQSKTSSAYGSPDDDYSVVAVVDNKLVINGSNIYQLEKAIRYFTEACIAPSSEKSFAVPESLREETVLEDHARENWTLYSVPAYPAGSNSFAPTYNAGSTFRNFTISETSDKNSSVVVISGTDEDEFNFYLAKLEKFGYTEKYDNKIENNRYYGYEKNGQWLWVSFIPSTSTVRIISDPAGMTPEKFGYTYTPKVGERSEFYLYGIPMDDGEQPWAHMNCGQCLIIKCADNSVIVVDGGDGSRQMNEQALAGLNDFLHSITGTPADGTVRIAAWYMTHYHGDHVIGFGRFMNKYKDRYVLERIIANVPAASASGTDTSAHMALIESWSKDIKVHSPNVKEMKVHAGQSIQIADVTLEILFTHENLLSAENGKFNSGDSNDTSTVIRVSNGKLSMMVVGDMNNRSARVIMGEFSEKALKSDILQSAHHGLYTVTAFNEKVNPSYVYMTQNRDLMEKTNTGVGNGHLTMKQNMEGYIKLVGKDHVYYAGNETVGLAYDETEGKIVVCYYSDVIPGFRPQT